MTLQRIHRLWLWFALSLTLILALLLPLGVWAWSGTGHFVLDSIGYTDGAHAHAYTVAPNFRQASGSLNQANSAISNEDEADVYVNFDYDTTGKSVYLVYTTGITAPNKSTGMTVTATLSKDADPNHTWYATIPTQAVGTTVNYVFYISDSNLASAYARISGAEADRNLSQYETSWEENDGDYFTYGVCGKAFTVTSNADDGAGSLRRAIVDACPGSTVIFSDTLAGQTITLTSELIINRPLTVDGGSQALTVSGNTTSHVFDIGASGVVTLSHLSIVSGTNNNVVVDDGSVGGGGIHNKGTLTVQDCVLSGNESTSGGGGIYNQGALTVQDCVLSDNESADNGGGISNFGGTLTVQNSVLSDNRAGKGGGGISNGGSGNPSMLILQDSTLSGNAATYGGGLFNSNNGQMTVHNSTLSGNAATGTDNWDGGGAIDQGSGSVSTMISNSTLVSNTAASPNQTTSGIWLEAGELTLHNSIVADNNGTNNFQQDGGTFISLGYNLSNAWNGLTTKSTDLTGDPQLGPLGDYGGTTWTHALLPNSPAIDAGDPATCPATDQRGALRTDPRCDIGAFELQHADSDTVIKTFINTVTHSFGPTRVSVTLALTDTGALTITKHLACPGGTCDTGEFPATWHITSSLSAELPPLTLSFCYTSDEIAGLTESDLQAYRWDGLQWTTPISTGLTVADYCVTLTGITEFSTWTLGSDIPMAVTLSRFEAFWQSDTIHIIWETATELDNLGFNLYRGESPAGPWVQLNPELIPTQHPGAVFGAVYEWLDADVTSGVAAYYRLEDVDVHGVSTFHGPISPAEIDPSVVRVHAFGAVTYQTGVFILALVVTGVLVVTFTGWDRRRSSKIR